MGSYKWGCKSPNMGYNYSFPSYNPTYITTHEPPSTLKLRRESLDRLLSLAFMESLTIYGLVIALAAASANRITSPRYVGIGKVYIICFSTNSWSHPFSFNSVAPARTCGYICMRTHARTHAHTHARTDSCACTREQDVSVRQKAATLGPRDYDAEFE